MVERCSAPLPLCVAASEYQQQSAPYTPTLFSSMKGCAYVLFDGICWSAAGGGGGGGEEGHCPFVSSYGVVTL